MLTLIIIKDCKYLIIFSHIGAPKCFIYFFQSRKALERISVPKIYHPFIVGPYGERVAAMALDTGARIHIPPASTQNNEIVIAGEKNGVLAAKAQIQEIYDDMVCANQFFYLGTMRNFAEQNSKYQNSGNNKTFVVIGNYQFKKFKIIFIYSENRLMCCCNNLNYSKVTILFYVLHFYNFIFN